MPSQHTLPFLSSIFTRHCANAVALVSAADEKGGKGGE